MSGVGLVAPRSSIPARESRRAFRGAGRRVRLSESRAGRCHRRRAPTLDSGPDNVRKVCPGNQRISSDLLSVHASVERNPNRRLADAVGNSWSAARINGLTEAGNSGWFDYLLTALTAIFLPPPLPPVPQASENQMRGPMRQEASKQKTTRSQPRAAMRLVSPVDRCELGHLAPYNASQWPVGQAEIRAALERGAISCVGRSRPFSNRCGIR